MVSKENNGISISKNLYAKPHEKSRQHTGNIYSHYVG